MTVLSRRTIALLACIVFAASSAIAGTLAWLTDAEYDVNVMTMGNIQIEQNEYGDLTDTTIPYKDTGLMPGKTVIKNVEVKNSGANDAYVRTVIAVEWPDTFGGTEIELTWAQGVTPTEVADTATIDGIPYKLYYVDYELASGMTNADLLESVTLTGDADNEDIEAIEGQLLVLVASQAVQTEGFTNMDEAMLGSWYEQPISSTNHPWADQTVMKTVTSNEELEDALDANQENIVVSLTGDMSVDVNAWETLAFGGDQTKKIQILGNGHTLTFNHLNSDWNNVATANGAVLELSNVNLTTSGYNDGPWNRHDINFACDVRLTNVTSDKALAFKAGAALDNVTIKDANGSDTYGIWIQPNGQTVTLNKVTVDMIDCTDGRGLKIDDQYVDAPQKVTLKVKDTTFKTEEKSAILVKCSAGADISLENVDISAVAADTTNAVWVDEGAAASYALVTVTGGTKAQE